MRSHEALITKTLEDTNVKKEFVKLLDQENNKMDARFIVDTKYVLLI